MIRLIPLTSVPIIYRVIVAYPNEYLDNQQKAWYKVEAMNHNCPECGLPRNKCSVDAMEYDKDHECDTRYCCECGYDFDADGVETGKVS